MGGPHLEDWRLKWPFTMIVAGPSGCGKSTFVGDVLRDVENAVVRTPAKRRDHARPVGATNPG